MNKLLFTVFYFLIGILVLMKLESFVSTAIAAFFVVVLYFVFKEILEESSNN